MERHERGKGSGNWGRIGRAARLAGLFAILAAGACLAFAQAASAIDPSLVAKADGPAGLKWIGGNRESPFMHPGLACIACHSSGEGPRFQAAGTVYKNIDEKNDYLGVPGINVELTDAKGVKQTVVSNQAGNFYVGGRGALAMTPPFKVKLVGTKATREMAMAAPSRDCNSCHTADGMGGAPGRIMAP